MSLLPDPHELLAIADRIARHADAARTRADQLAAAVDSADWRGAAADVFHDKAHGVVTGLRTSAGRLDDAAAALRVHAHRVAHVLAELDRLGHDVTHLGGDLAHTARDILTAPGNLGNDAGHLLHDGADLVHHTLDLVGL